MFKLEEYNNQQNKFIKDFFDEINKLKIGNFILFKWNLYSL